MKKTMIALVALSGMAMAANVTVTNSVDVDASNHAADRLDFHFNNSANRTVTLNATGDAKISATDGYGLETNTANANNVLNLNIEKTLTIAGNFKGTGQRTSTPATGRINVTTSMSSAELDTLSAGENVSRDVVTMSQLQSLTAPEVLTLTLTNADAAPLTLSDGGLVAKIDNAYYAVSNITFGATWTVDTTQAMTLADNTIYTYVKLDSDTGANPRAIGFVVTAPEPATATLSLLALAGLASRRRRH